MTNTTFEQTFVRMEQMKKVWMAMLPNVAFPSQDCAMRWALNYGDDIILHAIQRTTRKHNRMMSLGSPMSVEDVAAYAGSVMKNETLGNFSPAPQAVASEGMHR